MAAYVNQKRLTAERKTRALKARRVLRVEPLESRALLSAVGIAPQPMVPAESFALFSASLIDAATLAEASPAGYVRHEAPQPTAASPDVDAGVVDFTSAGQPASTRWDAVQTAIAGADLRLPFPMQAGDPVVAGENVQIDQRLAPLGEGFGVVVQSLPLVTIGTWEFPGELKVDGTPAGLNALLDGAGRRDAVVSTTGDVVEFRPDSSAEGGFIVLGSPLQSSIEVQTDGLRIAGTSIRFFRGEVPPAERKPTERIATFNVAVPQLPDTAELRAQTGASTTDVSNDLSQLGAEEEGKVAPLTSHDLPDAAEYNRDATAQQNTSSNEANVLEQAAVLEQADADLVGSAATGDEVPISGELSPLTNPLVQIRSSDLENDSESGLVGLNGTAASPLRTTGPAGDDSFQTSVDSVLAGTVPAEAADVGAALYPGGGAEDISQGSQAAASKPQAEPGQLSLWAFRLEEGGTIDLVAAALLREQNGTPPPTPGGETPLGDQEVRMDKGVGLFQAFDLSTVPTQGAEHVTLTSADVSRPVALPAAIATPAVFVPVRKESDAVRVDPNEQRGSHAVSLPSAVVAMLLTAAGHVHISRGAADRKWRLPLHG